ncbi:hypothetical protein [Paucimonas lemoignei]|uniref:hypothetical protein n=1 Tax=Paucimonas lemoignei TaxID=29443 RepID=UPI001045F63E|nr:hypothetical protein [Paucimonas lemoignei]
MRNFYCDGGSAVGQAGETLDICLIEVDEDRVVFKAAPDIHRHILTAWRDRANAYSRTIDVTDFRSVNTVYSDLTKHVGE